MSSAISETDSQARTDAVGLDEAQQPNNRDRTQLSLNSEFWFIDGSIILVAVKSSLAFRVHKTLLSLHSTIFQDMLSVPEPEKSGLGEMIEGCPVVDLDDTSGDVINLLRYVYNGRRHFPPHEQADFSLVVSLLKMSDKYGMDELRREALQYMQSAYPDTFQGWETSPNRPRMFSSECNDIVALNLARLVGEPTMIPIALYKCCQKDYVTLSKHTSTPGGSSLERLSRDDLERCVAASMRLVHLDHRLQLQLAKGVTPPDCSGWNACRVFVARALEVTLQSDDITSTYGSYSRDPLRSQQQIISSKQTPWKGLCNQCLQMFKQTEIENRWKVWDMLPKVLGVSEEVPGWGRNPNEDQQS